jgi:uncharacterized protein YqfA (UPF0365 family)
VARPLVEVARPLVEAAQPLIEPARPVVTPLTVLVYKIFFLYLPISNWLARNLISWKMRMKAGTYQTDSLPRIVILGGVKGLSDAAKPGGKDGEVNVIPSAVLSGGDTHFTK